MVASEILCRPSEGPMQLKASRQGTHPTKWAPPAQGARPAGHFLSENGGCEEDRDSWFDGLYR